MENFLTSPTFGCSRSYAPVGPVQKKKKKKKSFSYPNLSGNQKESNDIDLLSVFVQGREYIIENTTRDYDC